MKTEHFREHILPLKNRLFRKALSITESTAEAEDVVQEVMLRLWEQCDRWEAIGNMEVYALVLTKNLSINRIQRSGYRQETLGDSHTESFAADERIDREMEKQEDAQLVRRLIGMLPPKMQEAVRLREYEELDYRSIAEEMEISEAQVKINLFRARQKLKEMYLKTMNHERY